MRKAHLVLIAFVVALFASPLIFYGVADLISYGTRVHVKDEFYIEYLEMYASKSLWNGTQGFVGGVTKAYWNQDSLVVSGDTGCYLLIFGKTKLNDEMIPIGCEGLDKFLEVGYLNSYVDPQ